MTRLVAIILLALLWTSEASAYRQMHIFNVCRLSDRKLELTNGGLKFVLTPKFVSHAGAETVFRAAMQQYNDIQNSTIRFDASLGNNSTYIIIDSTSTVSFSDSIDSSGVAYTWFRFDTMDILFGLAQCTYVHSIIATDILFNDNTTWDMNLEGTGGNMLIDTALHELGHAAALLHEHRRMATMGFGSRAHFGLTWRRPELHSDETLAMRRIYAVPSANKVKEYDVAVNAWKHTGSYDSGNIGGAYGTIGYLDHPSVVYKGQYFKVEYTVENFSTASVGVDLRFYLEGPNASQNAAFGTLPLREIGRTTIASLSEGAVLTSHRYLKPPPDLPSGIYNIILHTPGRNDVNTENDRTRLHYTVEVRPGPVASGTCSCQCDTRCRVAVTSNLCSDTYSPSPSCSCSLDPYGECIASVPRCTCTR